MKLIDLVIDGLAAHRLARLVVDDDGPASTWIRDQADRHLPQAWAPVVECRHCTGLWAALAFAGLRTVGLGWVAYPLAVAGATTLALEVVAPDPEYSTVEAQGPVRATGTDGLLTDDDHVPEPTVPGLGLGYRPLVGRPLNRQERETGMTGVRIDGTLYADGVQRSLDDDERRYCRLAR